MCEGDCKRGNYLRIGNMAAEGKILCRYSFWEFGLNNVKPYKARDEYLYIENKNIKVTFFWNILDFNVT